MLKTIDKPLHKRLPKEIELRTEYFQNAPTSVLDEVKPLEMEFAGTLISTQKVGEYFDVADNTIRNLYRKMPNEFKGLMLALDGESLSDFKKNYETKGRSHLNVLTKRGVLLVALLLQRSPIAKEVKQRITGEYAKSVPADVVVEETTAEPEIVEEAVTLMECILKPTDLGVLMGGKNPQQVNNLLSDYRLQWKQGNKWLLTEKGKKYARWEVYYREEPTESGVPNIKTNFGIRWSPRVVDLLN